MVRNDYYTYDEPANPVALAPRPYNNKVWPATLTQRQQGASFLPAQLGAEGDAVKTIKDIIIIIGAILLTYWVLFGKSSPVRKAFSNPSSTGRNTIAHVSHAADGAWYWRLLRKRAKRHGPFATSSDAVSDAEAAGYSVAA